MSECSLIEENGRAHFLTKRFDRLNGVFLLPTLWDMRALQFALLSKIYTKQLLCCMKNRQQLQLLNLHFTICQ